MDRHTRLFRSSDHEGVGNLYSCAEGGIYAWRRPTREFLRYRETPPRPMAGPSSIMRAATSMPSTWHPASPASSPSIIIRENPTAAALCPGGEIRGVGGPRSQGRARRVRRARTDPPHAPLGRPAQLQSVPGSRPAGPLGMAAGDRRFSTAKRATKGPKQGYANYTVKPVPEPQENGASGRLGPVYAARSLPKGEHVAFANHRKDELWLLDLGSGAGAQAPATNRYGRWALSAWSSPWPLAGFSAE